jgi:hypothetical protein
MPLHHGKHDRSVWLNSSNRLNAVRRTAMDKRRVSYIILSFL